MMNVNEWQNSKPGYISLSVSQVNLIGRVCIFSLRTSSNLSLCATVIVFFQSPTVPEERGSKGRWEAQQAPIWSWPSTREIYSQEAAPGFLGISVLLDSQAGLCVLFGGHFTKSGCTSPLIPRDFLLLFASGHLSIAKEPRDAMYWPSGLLAEVASTHIM